MDALIDQIDELQRMAPSSDRFAPYFDEVMTAIDSIRSILDDVPAVLVHGDPSRSNVFWREESIGFIDWEFTHIGDPARELNRAREQLIGPGGRPNHDELVDALYDGYRQNAGSLPIGFSNRRPVYDVIWHLGTIGSFDRWVDSAEAPSEDVVDALETEMDRRLERVRSEIG